MQTQPKFSQEIKISWDIQIIDQGFVFIYKAWNMVSFDIILGLFVFFDVFIIIF